MASAGWRVPLGSAHPAGRHSRLRSPHRQAQDARFGRTPCNMGSGGMSANGSAWRFRLGLPEHTSPCNRACHTRSKTVAEYAAFAAVAKDILSEWKGSK
jgi:hypothetical protein